MPFQSRRIVQLGLGQRGQKLDILRKGIPSCWHIEDAVAILKPGLKQPSRAVSFQVEDNATKSSEEIKARPWSDGLI